MEMFSCSGVGGVEHTDAIRSVTRYKECCAMSIREKITFDASIVMHTLWFLLCYGLFGCHFLLDYGGLHDMTDISSIVLANLRLDP